MRRPTNAAVGPKASQGLAALITCALVLCACGGRRNRGSQNDGGVRMDTGSADTTVPVDHSSPDVRLPDVPIVRPDVPLVLPDVPFVPDVPVFPDVPADVPADVRADAPSDGGAQDGDASTMCSAQSDLGMATGPRVATGSTVGRPDVVSGCGSGPEAIYAWRAPRSGTYTFTTVGSAYDTMLSVRRGSCGGMSLGCDDDSGGSLSSRLSLTLTVSEMVAIIIDGYSGRSGSFVLNIGEPETACNDAVDNDLDGLVDCRDADCSGMIVCAEDCDNGTDDDADGLADCRDTQCASAPNCRENCADGIDNDLDSYIDCRDTECASMSMCIENCSDGLDNDQDGQIDCRDSSCSTSASCVENCTDMIDNDADGLVDCADSNCTTMAACNENCTDTVDNDNDGHVDCGDAYCAASASCAACAGSRNLGMATGMRVAMGTTVGASNRSTCGGTAPDVLFTWTAPAAGTWIFDTEGSVYDTRLGVYNGTCSGTVLGCDDDGGAGATSRVQATLTLGQRVAIAVDGYSTSAGTYALNITRPATETLCYDAVDDDLDGQTDCDDSDCAGSGGCERCFNGMDDDADLAIDCADLSCAPHPACTQCRIAGDLGGMLGESVATGTTVGAPSVLSYPMCTATAPEVVYRWRAPATASYVFDTFGSAFDTTVAVERGTSCGGTLVGCDARAGNGARLATALTGGTDVLVVVDSSTANATGSYVLNVHRDVPATETACTNAVDDDRDGARDCTDPDCSLCSLACYSCPARDLGSATGAAVATGSIVAAGCSREMGSCGGAGHDETLLWRAPAGGRYRFTVTGTGFAPVLYLRQGSCTGSESACAYDASGATAPSIIDNGGAGRVILIVIDAPSGSAAGSWSLAIQPA